MCRQSSFPFWCAAMLATCLLGLCSASTAKADFVGFDYDPITEAIVSATFSGDFAALVAHRTVAGYEVNYCQLRDLSSGLPDLDLSDDLFGTAEWPDPAFLSQGPLETGWVSADIDPTFFPALESGHVGLAFLFTDTDDALFAIDTLILTIETDRGTTEAYYGWPIDGENNGFGIGLTDGGNLPGEFPGILEPTGTGFDEEISSKTPEPTSLLLMVFGVAALSRRRGFPVNPRTPRESEGRSRAAGRPGGSGVGPRLLAAAAMLGGASLPGVWAAEPVARTYHVPVIVNYYTDSGMTEQKVRDALEKANKLLRDNNMNMILWIVEQNPNASGGDTDNDGELSQADGGKEFKAVNKAGKDEIEDTDNETGLKLSWVKDCWVEKPTRAGWAYRGEPVMVAEDTGSTDLNAVHILHELGHTLGIKLHSNGADHIMQEAPGLAGEKYTAAQRETMRDNVDDIGKCSEQFDEEYPGVRKKAQRGRKTDARGDHGGGKEDAPGWLDLCTARLRSEDATSIIDGFVSVDDLFEGPVDQTFILAFDSDADDTTGYECGPFLGREYAVELHVFGDAGDYIIAGLVRDLSDGSVVPLLDDPVIDVADISELEGVGLWNQLLFRVPKGALGLPDTLTPESPTEIPVGVYVDSFATIYDTNALTFYMDRWLRDPLLETFGSGVPTPGDPYDFRVSGLTANDPFVLYLDEEPVVEGTLDGSGAYEGDFTFPIDLLNTEAHFLTAQDSTGEFAYNLTCPKSPDQLHALGPIPNQVPVGETASIIATVQSGFVGVPHGEVAFTRLVGDFSFTSGDVSIDGSSSGVLTDRDGNAGVTLVGDGPGVGLVEVSVTGTNLSAFSFFQIVEGGSGPPKLESGAPSDSQLAIGVGPPQPYPSGTLPARCAGP